MNFYLTYNESPSGILSSQVIDVVKFLNAEFGKEVKLVAFISLRNFFYNRRAIRHELPEAIVVPMIPRMSNWRMNRFLLQALCRFYKPESIIARSVMATKLALQVRDKKHNMGVIYDGRGAIASEWKEYGVVSDKFLLARIEQYESEVIQLSDFRISVSEALLDLWKARYDYHGDAHVVIPCTLSAGFSNTRLSEDAVAASRQALGLKSDDVVFVYSGSLAGWQSFELTQAFIEPLLKSSEKNKIVFFSPSHVSISRLIRMFPGQVILKQLRSNEVQDFLVAGDYGLLIRENSDTNRVASPVKFAEYLACGLKVILSENLGDYAKMSLEKNWGYIFTEFNATIRRPGIDEKKAISAEAIRIFTKKNYLQAYKKIFNKITYK